jgi:hypothetical protein
VAGASAPRNPDDPNVRFLWHKANLWIQTKSKASRLVAFAHTRSRAVLPCGVLLGPGSAHACPFCLQSSQARSEYALCDAAKAPRGGGGEGGVHFALCPPPAPSDCEDQVLRSQMLPAAREKGHANRALPLRAVGVEKCCDGTARNPFRAGRRAAANSARRRAPFEPPPRLPEPAHLSSQFQVRVLSSLSKPAMLLTRVLLSGTQSVVQHLFGLIRGTLRGQGIPISSIGG